jgi:F0F1-type ATP synthase delta subunit
MNARAYAQALYQLSKKEGASAATLVKNVVKNLKESGRLKLLPHILRELRILDAQFASLSSIVEVAHKEDSAHALKAARAAGIESAHAVVNPSLIRGWRARRGGTLVDASGKRRLIELYRNITG